jgi:hypothetical protein
VLRRTDLPRPVLAHAEKRARASRPLEGHNDDLVVVLVDDPSRRIGFDTLVRHVVSHQDVYVATNSFNEVRRAHLEPRRGARVQVAVLDLGHDVGRVRVVAVVPGVVVATEQLFGLGKQSTLSEPVDQAKQPHVHASRVRFSGLEPDGSHTVRLATERPTLPHSRRWLTGHDVWVRVEDDPAWEATWESHAVFGVYVWEGDSLARWFRLQDCDVVEVLAWAGERFEGSAYSIALLVSDPTEPPSQEDGRVWLLGGDPLNGWQPPRDGAS